MQSYSLFIDFLISFLSIVTTWRNTVGLARRREEDAGGDAGDHRDRTTEDGSDDSVYVDS